MKTKKFYVVNSFAEKAFQGNPAAVFFDSSDLDESTMQEIAHQLNLVETVFINNSQDNDKFDFELKYFTPLKEVPIAGHPTVAAFIALEASRRIIISNKSTYLIKTKAGLKKIRAYKDNNETIIMMESSSPVFSPNVKDKYKIAEVFGLSVNDINEYLPIQPVYTGLGHLVVPVKSIDTLMKVKKNISLLKELCDELDVCEAQVFTFETYNEKFNIHTRNICPRNGIEDPGCGIGNAALGAYLLKNKYLNKNEMKLKAEQGKIINMPCVIEIFAEKRKENNIQVFVGGKGRVMIKGEFIIE